MRWALFYNQIKMANDILNSIPDDTTDPTLLSYRGQAKAIRAFDYLNVAPYFQFKYKGNEDKLCIPLVTEEMSADPNNPRATVQAVYDLIIRDLTDAINDLEGWAGMMSIPRVLEVKNNKVYSLTNTRVEKIKKK